LKDSLKDDLIKQPKLKASPGDETESQAAVTKSTRGHMKSFIDDAKEAVLKKGGTDKATYDAFADTVSDALDPTSAAAATKELMMEVNAADKRVARSFADTVDGHGGAAWMSPKSLGTEEEEEEEEKDDKSLKTPVVAPTVEKD
jgi:hypothetical protein